MKTLTATEARQNLGTWLSRALKGEDIGIISNGQIVALRPVKVYSEDYALIEYGLTNEEVKRAGDKITAQVARERKQGKLKKFV
jgi:antitoxin (DNA-binding transcriptional repressor) of toxin-antitoxin stability system